jgi:putative MATE family efflux protein
MLSGDIIEEAQSASWWTSVRESLSGVRRNYTSGSIPRLIVLLAIPMVLEMMMESLFGIVDIYFVARLGADSVATVMLTESTLVLVFGVALGLSLATTAFVARRIGENDPEGATAAAVQSIAIGVAISIVVGIAGIFFAPRMLALMGASTSVVATGHRYTAVLLGGSAVIFLIFLINAIFRGAGDPALAMRTLWLANAINIVLDPCLINGWGPFPKLGVMGAAVATTIGRGVGVLYQLHLLSSGKSRVRVRFAQFRLNLDVMWRLIRVSVNGMIQFLISTASWLGLIRIASFFGTAAVAGYGLGIRIFLFVILPSWGLSNAAATLVGQNLGAGHPERSERAVYLTGFYNMCYMGCLSVIFLLFAPQLAGFFTSDPEVLRVAVLLLRILSVGNICYAWGMVLVQAFNGAGDTFTPTVINFFCYWLFQIPLAYFLALRIGIGPKGVFSSIPAAEGAMTLCALIAFRRGNWKKKRL